MYNINNKRIKKMILGTVNKKLNWPILINPFFKKNLSFVGYSQNNKKNFTKSFKLKQRLG